MKYIYLIIFLLGHNFLSSQIINNLKVNDTLYVVFDEKSLFDDLYLEKIQNPNNLIYRYKFSGVRAIDFDVRLINITKVKNCMKKKDLINKKIMKNEDFLKEDYSRIVFELESNKIKIFIIDNSESKKRKVFIRQARMNNTAHIEM